MRGMEGEGAMEFPMFGHQKAEEETPQEEEVVAEVADERVIFEDTRTQRVYDVVDAIDRSGLSEEEEREYFNIKEQLASGELDPFTVASEIRELGRLGSKEFNAPVISPERTELYRRISAEDAVDLYALYGDELLQIENPGREETSENIEKKRKLDALYEQVEKIESGFDRVRKECDALDMKMDEKKIDLEEDLIMNEDKEALAYIYKFAEPYKPLAELKKKLERYMAFPPEAIPMGKINLFEAPIEDVGSVLRKVHGKIAYLNRRIEDVGMFKGDDGSEKKSKKKDEK